MQNRSKGVPAIRRLWKPQVLVAVKKILVIYYTQTGQLKQILDSMLRPLSTQEFSIDYLEIQPVNAYPFPWSLRGFLDVFPESVLEEPVDLKPGPAVNPGEHDLIILAFQPWYLSPSLPVTAFLKSPAAARLLKGANLLTVIGARNMWVKSFERVKAQVETLGGTIRGNIVLVDKAPNLVSLVTICYWMFGGRKARFLGVFPAPGVSGADIEAASSCGGIIRQALLDGRILQLDDILQQCGGAGRNLSLARLENRAKRVFLLWAGQIRKRPRLRKVLLGAFFLELVLAFVIVSPLNSLLGLVLNKFKGRRTVADGKQSIHNQAR
ncbi:MAG: dialkylresorcinol condensing enzyme DarA [bacterium]